MIHESFRSLLFRCPATALARRLAAALMVAALSVALPVRAIDAVYLGGQVGNVSLTGDVSGRYSNAIGFGVDLGVRTNSILDVTAHFQHSSHSGGFPGFTTGLTINDLFLSADIHALGFNDFELSFTFGPGFYFFNQQGALGLAGVSNTYFGLNFGAIGDVKVNDNIVIGLDGRYHVVFNNAPGGNLWTIMLRAGYLFDVQ